jgi:hypothetical protein
MRGTWTAQILVNSNPIIQASIKSLACWYQRLQIQKYFVFLSGSWSNESSHIQIPKVSNQVTRTRIKRDGQSMFSEQKVAWWMINSWAAQILIYVFLNLLRYRYN